MNIKKRPFFFLALLISFVILATNFFVRSILHYTGHVSYFVSEMPRHFAVDGLVVSTPVVKYTTFGDTYSFLIRPKLLRVGDKWFPAHGTISVTSRKDVEFNYGEEVLFEAEFKAPLDGKKWAGYRAYLNRKGIFATGVIRAKDAVVILGADSRLSFKKFACGVKSALKKKISVMFSRRAGHFLSAVLLGDRENIPMTWKEIFVNTQTIHLLAISGLHVGIISFIVLFLLNAMGFGRGPKYIIAIALVLFYAFMVGWMPSVARAAIMGSVLMGSYALKKRADIYNSLGFAACAILIFHPAQLFDLGFILSFIAVFSLVYITPKIKSILRIDTIDRKKKWGNVLYYFAMVFSGSLAVWLGIFPVILYSFNLISIASLVINVLVVPCLFLIMSFSISALVFSGFCGFLCGAFRESSEFFITALLQTVNLFSRIPFSYFKSAPVSVAVIPLYYVLIFALFEKNKLNGLLNYTSLKLKK